MAIQCCILVVCTFGLRLFIKLKEIEMEKEFLDMLYSQRSFILGRASKLNERSEFDGSVGSCDEPIWRMQVAEVGRKLEDIDKIITEYIRIHGN